MVVKVVSRVGQAFSRSLDSLSLADGSMLLRMRRASIALLALVGAVGLGLIVFIAQLGWPGVVSGPLPGPPTQVGTVHDSIALTETARRAGAIGPAAVAAGESARNLPQRGTRGSDAGGRSQLGDGRELTTAAGAKPGQGVDQPVAQPAPQPEPATAPPAASAPATAVVEAPPQSSSADQAKKAAANSKATETAIAKAVSDSSKSTGEAATKSQAQKSASDKGSPSKTSDAASAKAKRDESAAKTNAPSPSATPEKSAPAASPAAAKEAADAANSD
jgi:hypothetical protein